VIAALPRSCAAHVTVAARKVRRQRARTQRFVFFAEVPAGTTHRRPDLTNDVARFRSTFTARLR
jgi:hypothetical protein